MKVHLELVLVAVLAGSLTTRLLVTFNASVTPCIISSLVVIAVVLFLLERRYGHDLDAFLQLFAKVPLVWSLVICAGVYSYSFAMILHLASWAVILCVGVVITLCWRLAQRKFQYILQLEVTTCKKYVSKESL